MFSKVYKDFEAQCGNHKFHIIIYKVHIIFSGNIYKVKMWEKENGFEYLILNDYVEKLCGLADCIQEAVSLRIIDYKNEEKELGKLNNMIESGRVFPE